MKKIIFVFAILAASCASQDEDPQPAQALRPVSSFEIARHRIDPGRFHLYLFGADTLTFTNIVPDPSLVGVFDFDTNEGAKGKFKNASLYHNGTQTQVLQSGRLTIRAFKPGESIDLVYDVTFANGDRIQGSWAGKISPI